MKGLSSRGGTSGRIKSPTINFFFLEAETDVERRHDDRVGVAWEGKAHLIGRAKRGNQLTSLTELVVEATDQLMCSQARWRNIPGAPWRGPRQRKKGREGLEEECWRRSCERKDPRIIPTAEGDGISMDLGEGGKPVGERSER
jgi:hypothetical protein